VCAPPAWTSIRPVAFCVLALACLWPTPGIAQDGGEGFWRRTDNDGILCLFLELRWCGYNRSFEQYLAEIGDDTKPRDFKSLVSAAKRLGYDLAPIQISMTDIEKMDVPPLVHLERTDGGSGYFAVVVECNERFVLLVNGPQAAIRQIRKDTFRREWSGYALVPVARSTIWPLCRRALSVMMVSLVTLSMGTYIFAKGKQWQLVRNRPLQST
jgi:Peptidase C39 family